MDFLRDFFFTDIPNHAEFSKWTQTLDKGDGTLLIALLERLLSTEPPRTVSFGDEGRNAIKTKDERTPLKPHCPSPSLPKNPLNIATGYGMMQDLDDHSYNIYEYAYLAPNTNWKTRNMAYLAVIIQILFVAVLVSYNFKESKVLIAQGEDGFKEVCVIMVLSIILITITIRVQFSDSKKFNEIFTTITRSRPLRGKKRFLILNFLINQVLGIFVFFFNFYFILVSDSPTDAVLNSVALAFILEIDDFFHPNWDDDKLEDAAAQVLKDYIAEPLSFEEVVVERIAGRGLLDIADDDKLYVSIDPDPKMKMPHDGDHFTVTVYVANREEDSEVHSIATSYDATVYHVGGTKQHKFRSALAKFHCLDNFRDFCSTRLCQDQQSLV